jgi:hypothetical protein
MKAYTKLPHWVDNKVQPLPLLVAVVLFRVHGTSSALLLRLLLPLLVASMERTRIAVDSSWISATSCDQRLRSRNFVLGNKKKITRGQIGQVSNGGNFVSDPSGELANCWMCLLHVLYDLPSMTREMGKSYVHLCNFRFMKEFCHISGFGVFKLWRCERACKSEPIFG